MYRIIGIIALVGTLAGCPNPTTQQPATKTFDGEYKVILQSGPFRGPLNVRYGYDTKNSNRSDGSVIVTTLPWSATKRETVLGDGQGTFLPVSLYVSYARPRGWRRPVTPNPETVCHLEVWSDGELKERDVWRITDDTRYESRSLRVEP